MDSAVSLSIAPVVLCALCVFLGLPSPGAGEPTGGGAAPELPDAKSLLDAMDRARGERPAGVARLVGTAGWPDYGLEGATTELYGGPRRVHVERRLEEHGTFEQGADESCVYERSPHGVVLRSGWEACEVLRRYGRAQGLPWSEMYEGGETVRTEELDGRRCFVLELVPRWMLPGEPAEVQEETGELPRDTLWLDAETHLPLRAVGRGVGREGNTTEVRVDYGDWRERDGARWPHRRAILVSGAELVVQVESVEHGAEVADAAFDAGRDVREAIEAGASGDGGPPAESIGIEEVEEQHLASIRVECSHDEMQETLAAILPETMEAAHSMGAQVVGAPIVRYHEFGDVLDLEGGMPVSRPIEPKGRVEPSTLPAGRAVVAWHLGPYDELGETHERVQAWLAERDLATGAPWEEFWTDPGMEPDPSKWRTRVVYPIEEE